MNRRADVAQGRKTCRVVASLPITFDLGGGMWVPSLAYSPIEYGSVEKEKEIGNEIRLDLDARLSDA
jgi:hypothetical protein